MRVRLAGELRHSFVNGPGVRYVVFFQGCPHHCPGCHNPETHPPNGGEEGDTREVIARIRGAKLLDGVTLSGGDPFAQPGPCAEIAAAAKALGLSVWAYSGWLFEELLERLGPEGLAHIDVLVDGRFDQAQKGEDCLWRGSRNQRLIDVPASLAAGHGVEWAAG